MSAIEKFTQFLSEFVKTALWQAMETCVEDSPWHREANTAVHTQMMIQWYLENLWTKRSERDRLITLVLIVFHDVGKPEDRRWSEEKQRYHFSGHEQTSAERFRQWTLDNLDTIHMLGLNGIDCEGMYWALYRHVPFTLLVPKTVWLKETMFASDMDQIFIDLVMCDQYGRISDDHQANQDKVFEWLEKRWLGIDNPRSSINIDDYPRKISPLPVNGYVVGTQIVA